MNELQDAFRERLYPPPEDRDSIFVSAEASRRWMPASAVGPFEPDLPLGAKGALRIMDGVSQGQISANTGHILAVDREWRLNTVAARRDALTLHSNHADWSRPSPLISADASPYSTIARARRYQSNGRGPARVSLINNKARVRAGHPTLSAYDEMVQYGVEDPYHRGYEYYRGQILYPYAVLEEEIVGTWDWSEVEEVLREDGSGAWVQFLREQLEQHEQAALQEWQINHPIMHI